MIPAWTLLDRKSFESLLNGQHALPDVIHVAANVSPDDIADVPIVGACRALVERAKAQEGLTLTKGGALSRADVRALFDDLDWPHFDRNAVLAVNKVLNEPDVLPILFARLAAQAARLLRARKGRLLATKRADLLLREESTSDLFRALFETVFWRTNLAYFDAMPAQHWPQAHIGVVLWSLSVAAHGWSTAEDLTVACTSPDDDLMAAASDFSTFAMITRVLRPLTWFGLLETKELDDLEVSKWLRTRLYRKSPLFDRALSFQISVSRAGNSLQ